MKTCMRRVIRRLVPTCLFLSLFINAVNAAQAAEDFPKRPITMYITYSAGGSTDLSTRAVAEAASKILKQPIVCVNKPGGLGAAAISELLSKKADGYTLSTIGYGLVTVVPHLQNLSFNPLDDLTHIMSFGRYVYCVGVKADAQWKTWEEFRDYAKQNPGSVSYGVSSIGNPVHICMEQIGLVEGIKWKVVTYKGGTDCIIAVLGGHIAAATPTSEFVSYAKAKTFRPLLIMSPGGRLPAFPEIPSIEEKGYKFSALSGIAICAPKGLPESIRKKLEDALKQAMEASEFQSTMETLQMIPDFVSGPDLVRMWRADYPVQGQMLGKMGLAKEK